MNTRIRACCVLLFLLPTVVATTPTASAGTDQDGCSHLLADRDKLPHTADAIEGWFRACHERSGQLPRTADGAAGWVG